MPIRMAPPAHIFIRWARQHKLLRIPIPTPGNLVDRRSLCHLLRFKRHPVANTTCHLSLHLFLTNAISTPRRKTPPIPIIRVLNFIPRTRTKITPMKPGDVQYPMPNVGVLGNTPNALSLEPKSRHLAISLYVIVSLTPTYPSSCHAFPTCSQHQSNTQFHTHAYRRRSTQYRQATLLNCARYIYFVATRKARRLDLIGISKDLHDHDRVLSGEI